jgi:fatty acid-binding protein DegV
LHRLDEVVSNENVREISILYGLHPEKALLWKKMILEKYPHLTIHIYPLGSAIGLHAGENTIGISWFYT